MTAALIWTDILCTLNKVFAAVGFPDRDYKSVSPDSDFSSCHKHWLKAWQQRDGLLVEMKNADLFLNFRK